MSIENLFLFRLQAHTVETDVAVIVDGGVTLKIDTQHLTDLSLRLDSVYEFIGSCLFNLTMM